MPPQLDGKTILIRKGHGNEWRIVSIDMFHHLYSSVRIKCI
uniref:Uncharacterized protein n=1 Tax=Arundo donax TaxID=35708 RepID=A0A0A9A345_ARUDO